MLIIDLLILSILYIFIEWLYLKDKYTLFSPYMLFNTFFLVVYLIPYILYAMNLETRFFELSTPAQIAKGYMYIRTFYYMFFVMSMWRFYRIKHVQKQEVKGLNSYRNDVFYLVTILSAVIFLFISLQTVNFNIVTLVDKLINPRKYTYLRTGFGIANHILNAAKFALLLVVFNKFYKERTGVMFIVVLLSVVLFILGGNKSSFVYIVLIGAVIYEKHRNKQIRLIKVFMIGILAFIALVFGFALLYSADKTYTLTKTFLNMQTYQREAGYTISVISRFKWQPKYFFEGIYDIIVSFIPRNIWPNKPHVGFYNRYFRAEYEPATLIYHTTTFGFLSEAYMMFGNLGPFIYSFLMMGILDYTYKRMKTSKTNFQMFIPLYIILNLYGVVRAGVTSVMLSNFVFEVAFAYVLLELLPRTFQGKTDMEQTWILDYKSNRNKEGISYENA